MREALEQVVAVAPRLVEDQSLLDPDVDGRLLVRIPPSSPGVGTWVDARRAPPPPIGRPVPEFDRARAEQLRVALPRAAGSWECDLFPMRAVVAEPGGRPYAPAVFLIADSRAGMILRSDVGEPAGREAWAQERLMKAVEALGALPSALILKRPELERVLRPVAEALGVRVQHRERLWAADPAREGLDQMALGMGRGRA